jgi:serine/threonine-protein kinase
MNRIVALKLLRKELVAQTDLVQRFEREVAAAAKLVHPNIVVAYDAAAINGVHFMAMEYAEGQNLKRRMQQMERFPIATACDFVRQAAEGLQHAHEQGLVHRDIKPSNLLLTRDPVTNKPLIKILDFGLARFTSEQIHPKPGITAEGQAMGTPDFMSPEQAQNARAADIRADIYSLGCVLFFFLTGKGPFVGKSMLERLTARLMSDPLPLRSLRPEASAELEQVVLKMMAREPAARYQTPAEVAAALASHSRVSEAPPIAPASAERQLPVDQGAQQPIDHGAQQQGADAPRSPTSSWFLSCVLLVLGFSTVLFVGAAAFLIFFLMQRSQ